MNNHVIKGVVLCCVIALASCQNNAAPPAGDENHKDSVRLDAYAFKTTEGWGYGITVDNKPFIRQPIIPAIQGVKGFATEDDAQKVAALVINKIKAHQKPTIFKTDLQTLGITE